MSVNGVAINVGQKWRTKDGDVYVVVDYNGPSSTSPWTLRSPQGPMVQFSNDGVSEYHMLALHELVDVTDYREAPSALSGIDPVSTNKPTNPKEALGDKKTPLWLCSPIAEGHWSAAQAAGLLKYGAWNWRAAGVKTSTYLSAIRRHHARYANGERLDPVDGTHHLGNIMACCAILLEAEYLGKLNDDRGPAVNLQALYDEIEGMVEGLKGKYADRMPKHYTIHDETVVEVPVNAFTMSRLNAACANLSHRGGRDTLVALFNALGIKKLPEIAPEHVESLTLMVETLNKLPTASIYDSKTHP